MYRIKNYRERQSIVRAELSQLANSYYSTYKLSTQTLKEHGIVKKLKGNKGLVIAHLDKGNVVVIMNRKDCDKAMYDILFITLQ